MNDGSEESGKFRFRHYSQSHDVELARTIFEMERGCPTVRRHDQRSD